MNYKIVRILLGSCLLGTLIVVIGDHAGWGVGTQMLLTVPAGALLAIVEH